MKPDDERRSSRTISASNSFAPTLGQLTSQFNQWFDHLDLNENFWPAFDRWVRDTLNQFLGARRVRCFQVAETDHQLSSLTNDLDDLFLDNLPSHSLIHHVVASGRRYLRGAPNNGELTEKLADEWAPNTDPTQPGTLLFTAPDWLLPIREKDRTIGLIVAGELPEETTCDLDLVQSVGHLFELYWRYVYRVDALAIAERTDRASGVLNRIDLGTVAERILGESTSDAEPVVVLALAVEGVRRLDDQGQWKVRDWLMREIGVEMRCKLRSDDIVGRFSDDRFVAILRRLDSTLGKMIALKLLEAVQTRINQQPVVRDTITLRCGLTDSQGEGFESVLVRTFKTLDQARQEKRAIILAPAQSLQKVTDIAEVGL